jgi:hypothetical protein
MNRETAISYLNGLDQVYVLDGFANWDPEVCVWQQQLLGMVAGMISWCSNIRSTPTAAACLQHRPVRDGHSSRAAAAHSLGRHDCAKHVAAGSKRTNSQQQCLTATSP